MMPTGHGTRKRWSNEDRDLFLRMKADRKSGSQIAKHFGVSKHAVDHFYARLIHPEIKLKRRDEKPRPTVLAKKLPWQRSGERWTEDESSELVARIDKGEDVGEIAVLINRTRWACVVQYNALKRGKAQPAADDMRTTRTNREKMDQARQLVLQNRVEHQSLTAAFFGDPLPGRSALDRMRVGLA